MSTPTTDEDMLRGWIGRSETHQDVLAVGQAKRMAATLDRMQEPAEGDALPPLWHWIYFNEAVARSALGRDGHARRGGFLPPVDLPRRMWAGGRFGFVEPLRLGEAVTRHSTIRDVAVKHGRTGPLCFVTVRHDLAGPDGAERFWEEHDIVYREDPAPGAPAPAAQAPPGEPAFSRTVTPSPVLLFRYSALTFNGHRIHYDRDYCRDVEGYPGLVFHGPLTATLLADLAQEHGGGRTLATFSFRALAPLFDTAPFVLRGKPSGPDDLELWAETPRGGLAMTAKAHFGS
ncbi:MAG: MaoC family dehydratase N-terminal domain-containing protein [Proteobacteria bacterium]|nr:MaoC family dehydratase N-terminal domain-containing protein [Pseudomonadota bacterium]MDA0951131.1 MaoC family dehydratase N-terminal domain-containing protein [Pseudomonadota bacterium]